MTRLCVICSRACRNAWNLLLFTAILSSYVLIPLFRCSTRRTKWTRGTTLLDGEKRNNLSRQVFLAMFKKASRGENSSILSFVKIKANLVMPAFLPCLVFSNNPFLNDIPIVLSRVQKIDITTSEVLSFPLWRLKNQILHYSAILAWLPPAARCGKLLSSKE